MAYMLKRQDGFRLFLDDGHIDIDSNLVENAIRRPAMNRRTVILATADQSRISGNAQVTLKYSQ